MNASKNLEMLAVVARGLRELKDQVVFVGGATVDLYIPNPGGTPLRTTDDVDCVVGIASRVEYGKLEERLRGLGFTHPLDDPQAPICRWRYSGVIVDVMPVQGSVLGFSNRWYPEGVERAEQRMLPDGQKVAVFALPYFLASKIEAFLGRGKGDFYASEDIEDIVSVLDGGDDVAAQISNAPKTVGEYLKKEFSVLLADGIFADCIQGHLGPRAEADRVRRVLDLMKAVIAK